VTDTVRRVAIDRGVPIPAVALAWVSQRPAVASTIVGARTPEQLAANLSAAGLVLDAEETRLLDETSSPDADPYPYGDFGTEQRSRSL
jgi:aryl-alcohol dehydrogenase-like predicted oxidoreductase